MAERRVNVGWAEGLHARPASIFVRAATAAGVPVTIAKADGAPVNAASMLAVLSLGAQGGEEVVLTAEAEGAEAALDRLAKLVAEGLEELLTRHRPGNFGQPAAEFSRAGQSPTDCPASPFRIYRSGNSRVLYTA
jgi:phosphocarrier protein